jgi:hypothetical protein
MIGGVGEMGVMSKLDADSLRALTIELGFEFGWSSKNVGNVIFALTFCCTLACGSDAEAFASAMCA